MADDPRVRREQTRLGRMINRVDNALVTLGAALTFSKQQRHAAKESNRAVQPPKVASQQQIIPDARRDGDGISPGWKTTAIFEPRFEPGEQVTRRGSGEPAGTVGWVSRDGASVSIREDPTGAILDSARFDRIPAGWKTAGGETDQHFEVGMKETKSGVAREARNEDTGKPRRSRTAGMER